MNIEINPFEPPEAPIVERAVAPPRPFRVFLAGASCCGVAVIPVFVALALGVSIFATWRTGRLWQVPPSFVRRQVWLLIFSGYCGITCLASGVSFLGRRGQTGRRLLVASLAGVGIAALFFRYVVD